MNDFFLSAHDVLLQVLGALAIGLGLCEDEFSQHHLQKHHELRLLHYPSIPASTLEKGGSTRISSHTDFGSMSLLFQDSVGGLEGEDFTDKAKYLPIVTDRRDVMIVLLGDLMMRWTNRHLCAVPHRVTFPAKSKYGSEAVPERFSLAFFGRPDRDVRIAPLHLFVSGATPAGFQGIIAGEYYESKETKMY